MSDIYWFAVEAVNLAVTIGLYLAYRRLEEHIDAVDAATELTFSFVGGDIGEVFFRLEDVETALNTPRSPYATDAANDETFYVTGPVNGG